MKFLDTDTLKFIYKSFGLFRRKKLHFSSEQNLKIYTDMEFWMSLRLLGLFFIHAVFLWLANGLLRKVFYFFIWPFSILNICLAFLIVISAISLYQLNKFIFIKIYLKKALPESFYRDIFYQI